MLKAKNKRKGKFLPKTLNYSKKVPKTPHDDGLYAHSGALIQVERRPISDEVIVIIAHIMLISIIKWHDIFHRLIFSISKNTGNLSKYQTPSGQSKPSRGSLGNYSSPPPCYSAYGALGSCFVSTSFSAQGASYPRPLRKNQSETPKITKSSSHIKREEKGKKKKKEKYREKSGLAFYLLIYSPASGSHSILLLPLSFSFRCLLPYFSPTSIPNVIIARQGR
jgi:hypothetical protein